ncbi:LysR family transcriptional regulator [Chromobacterium sp. IIBBL 290-4]|uniref:LysR family transcriptional regulator n=1 Tax=Chromobacterium sp. IIBBL 290-4 TaxID=2953890 RepID=UPI0020B7E03A|nr:LysR family transcriptional regulator [Chromobacterium sp. IIBBL 290-4]UTH75611.1 LysR family transcriptional regulator [Chromobacterium sp. IIBBL 290-4]
METGKQAEWLVVFVEVARRGSLSAAAKRRGVTVSAVSRQLDQLETHFGAALLLRTSRGAALTDSGEVLFARAQGILDALADLEAEVRAVPGTVEGVLRISCLPTFGKRQILPWLPEWQARYPQLRLELDLSERLANPSLERLDGAIRIGPLADSRLYASRIGTQRWVVVASADYLAKHGAPDSVADLRRHRLLDKLHDAAGYGWRGVLPDAGAVLRCDDYEALAAAARLGLGLALLPDWAARAELQAGSLRLAMDDPLKRSDDIHLLRALPAMPAKLNAFRQALAAWLDPAGGD